MSRKPGSKPQSTKQKPAPPPPTTFDDDDDDVDVDVDEDIITRYTAPKHNHKRKRPVDEDEEEEDELSDDLVEDLVMDGDGESGQDGEPGQESKQTPKVYANNRDGLLSAIREISLPSTWPWIESLTITSREPLVVDNPHDDLKREAAFYSRTVAGVEQALSHLTSSGIPFKRPDDYFAEMVKPDAQMAKIKDSLLNEKARMEATAERKKQQEQKKFAKQVQANKLQERQKEKKKNMEEVSKMRKASRHSDVRIERSTLPGLDEAISQNRAQDKVKHDAKATKSAKRKGKDQKYGFGGKKKHIKSNTAKSSSDMRGFNKGGGSFGKQKPGSNKGSGSHKGSGSFKGGAGSNKPKGGNRPGKRARQQSNK